MQAVILAGGIGSRLRPITDSIPKPMVRVGGKPFLEHLLKYGASQGVDEFVLCIGHLAEKIMTYFGDGSNRGLSIVYSEETEPLGTAGALKNALQLLEDRFLVLYGDTWLPVSYMDIINELEASDADAVMTVAPSDRASPNARFEGTLIVAYDKLGRLPKLNAVDAGILALRRKILETPTRETSLELDIYPRLISNRRLLAHQTFSSFVDIGTLEGLARAEEVLGHC